MKKTLSITIEDTEKVDGPTISGSLDESQFNPNIVIAIGGAKISVNSKNLAEGLSELVKFQTPVIPDKAFHDNIEKLQNFQSEHLTLEMGE